VLMGHLTHWRWGESVTSSFTAPIVDIVAHRKKPPCAQRTMPLQARPYPDVAHENDRKGLRSSHSAAAGQKIRV